MILDLLRLFIFVLNFLPTLLRLAENVMTNEPHDVIMLICLKILSCVPVFYNQFFFYVRKLIINSVWYQIFSLIKIL